ncbi:YdcF family protein [Hymenobacter jejuensis]|nr:YdcF family protein [Hymenobacter jejuensis]
MSWRYLFRLTALLCCVPILGSAQPVLPRLSAARTDSVIVAKTFPLLSLFETHPALRRALQTDPELQRISRRQAERTYQALRKGPPEPQRYADSLAWNPQEIQVVGKYLVNKYLHNNELHAALAPVLAKTGRYPVYADRPDTAVLRLAWRDAALGLNRIVRVYFGNAVPRYPAIDSSSFRRHDAAFAKQVRADLRPLSRKARRHSDGYYTLPLQAALLALRLNQRDEAARYEPLEAGLNQAPRAAVATTAWVRYPYSLILVPGHGPEETGVALDTLGAYRCRLAAASFRKGQAPFIMVSGGHVHPNKTPYCEAVEMKRYLVEKLGLPDAAVLIEPHARHTTTNLRNAVRMLYNFGMPTDRPVLTVTDAAQSRSIVAMAERCKQEFGYVPYRDMQRLSDEESVCFPVPEARQPDPYDPLDP